PGFLAAARGALDLTVGAAGAPLDAAAAALAERTSYRGDLAALIAAVGGYTVRWESLLDGRGVRLGALAPGSRRPRSALWQMAMCGAKRGGDGNHGEKDAAGGGAGAGRRRADYRRRGGGGARRTAGSAHRGGAPRHAGDPAHGGAGGRAGRRG